MAPPCSPDRTRRTLLCLAPAALLYVLGSRRALAAPLSAEVFDGLQQMNELAVRLRGAEITPEAWQHGMAALVARLDVQRVVETIDLPRLNRDQPLPDDRALVRHLDFPDLDRALRDAGVRLRLFGLQRGRAIVPHGHHDMVSMHWVLSGSVHARHWDRIERTPEHLLMRPSIDRILRPGMATSISEQRDNVHWFVAVDGPAYSLGVTLSRLGGEGPHGRVYVDPRAAVRETDDRLRVPILSPIEARRRYGRG